MDKRGRLTASPQILSLVVGAFPSFESPLHQAVKVILGWLGHLAVIAGAVQVFFVSPKGAIRASDDDTSVVTWDETVLQTRFMSY